MIKKIVVKIIRHDIQLTIDQDDLSTIDQCLRYCIHRLKNHPEAGIKKVVNVKKLEEILKAIA